MRRSACHSSSRPAGDGLCKLWDAASGSEVAQIAADSGPVNLCTFVALPAPPGAPPQSSSSDSGATAVSHYLGSQRLSSLLVTCHINQQRQVRRRAVAGWHAAAWHSAVALLPCPCCTIALCVAMPAMFCIVF